MQLTQLGIQNTFPSRGPTGIDAEWANNANEVLFVVQGDSTCIDSNGSTGAGPANNGKLWNGSAFVALGTVGPGVGTTDGSFCQQFALDYYTRTGKVVCFVNSGVGGAKIVDVWDGVSATFAASMTEVGQAMTAGGFPKPRFILKAGVNDSTAAESTASVGAAFSAWIDAINTAYPTTEILYVMFGVKAGQTTRAQILRCLFREKRIATANVHVPYSELYLADWAMIADGTHPSQTGYNFGASKMDQYLAMESLGYDRFARTIINGQKSLWASWPAGDADEYNDLISGMIADGDWHNITTCFNFDVHDDLDRFVDWTMLSRLVDRGVVVTTDDCITTNTGQTLNIPCTPVAVPWRTHSNTDFFIGILFGDILVVPSGAKIAAGVSTGTTIMALQQGATGLLTFYGWGNTGPTKTGGYQNNTMYAWGREGTAAPGGAGGDVVSWIDGTENARLTAAAGTANTTGPEIGDRYTAGPAGFPLNAEYKCVIMGLGSAVNQADIRSRLVTFYAAI